MPTFEPRHPISRAKFFLELASRCGPEARNEFEAFLDAAIVFGRTAIHHFKHKYGKHPNWSTWFSSMNANPSVAFFRENRDLLLKETSLKVGQRIGAQPAQTADSLYFFNPDESAATTVRNHLEILVSTLELAEAAFEQYGQ